METLINFLMGFSTALLPAMVFIAYFLHRSGNEVTTALEKQLHVTAKNLNTTRESLVVYKKRLANSERNNIELSKELDKAQKDLEDLKAEIAENKVHYTKTTKTVVETLKNDHDIPEAVVVSEARPLEKASDQKEWVRAQLNSVKAQLNSLKKAKRESYPGYVYVISNDEVFGEGNLLIRANKRLEPMDVVQDLSEDSKIFNFDVQLVLHNQDAPLLEERLHSAFKACGVISQAIDKKLFKVDVTQVSQAIANIQNNPNQQEQEASSENTVPETFKHAA